jgi:transcriptional regulator with XRE-family HTH domain
MARRELRSFGAAVRRRRTQLAISQEKLAERAGLHRTYVSGIERGERNVGLVNVHRLAKALGVPVSELFAEASRR